MKQKIKEFLESNELDSKFKNTDIAPGYVIDSIIEFVKGEFDQNFDPWNYVSEGKLPELGGDLDYFKSSEAVYVMHREEGELPFIADLHWKQTDDGEHYYWEDYGENPIIYQLEEIHCWQYITKPKK